ncbi:uncharacterized protein B0H18DRAFT_478341 [Fomitopsis serialis]|uniref:uncharacterized protein n=1 Tax=Fomitopsis serialis TaxID=139415 RepID=UPI0020076784|nr:uncharacterized protein B0H18DRAFT_478341 [Neoantrodia serialis]KAH9923040.1 hypothetical protein B0H18DRAFT_478341 [Neoantrodia serialis]
MPATDPHWTRSSRPSGSLHGHQGSCPSRKGCLGDVDVPISSLDGHCTAVLSQLSGVQAKGQLILTWDGHRRLPLSDSQQHPFANTTRASPLILGSFGRVTERSARPEVRVVGTPLLDASQYESGYTHFEYNSGRSCSRPSKSLCASFGSYPEGQLGRCRHADPIPGCSLCTSRPSAIGRMSTEVSHSHLGCPLWSAVGHSCRPLMAPGTTRAVPLHSRARIACPGLISHPTTLVRQQQLQTLNQRESVSLAPRARKFDEHATHCLIRMYSHLATACVARSGSGWDIGVRKLRVGFFGKGFRLAHRFELFMGSV